MDNAKDLFNRRAAVWDKSHTADPERIKLMLALSNLRAGMDFLDVGCGTGVLEPYLLAFEPGRIIAVDFAEKMIETARNKNNDSRIEYICADVFSLSGKMADCCFLYNSYPYFDDPARLLSHLATLIRPGGRLSISHTRGKAGEGYIGQTLFGEPTYPNQALVGLMRPHFYVDVSVDSSVLFLTSGIVR